MRWFGRSQLSDFFCWAVVPIASISPRMKTNKAKAPPLTNGLFVAGVLLLVCVGLYGAYRMLGG